MRFVRQSFFSAIIIGLVGFSSCNPSGPGELSVEESQLKLLSKTWVVSEVRFGSGNTDRKSEYTGMTLIIEGTFNSTPGTEYKYTRSTLAQISPWPTTGKWSFDLNDPENLIIRTEDNLPMSYSVTGNQLQLVFTYSGPGYAGRASAVDGSWTFLFTEKP